MYIKISCDSSSEENKTTNKSTVKTIPDDPLRIPEPGKQCAHNQTHTELHIGIRECDVMIMLL